MRPLRLLPPILAAATLAFGNPPEPSAEGEGWTIVHEVEGIKVYQRVSDNPDLKEYKAVAVFALPPGNVSAVLKDRGKYTEFFPYLEENRPIQKDGKHYSYERIGAPLVAERDYTVEHVDEDLEGGGFRIRFHEANDVGPPPSDKVRVQVVRGKWEVLALAANRCQITYHVYTDPGGAIPNFIINAANKRGVSRAVQALRDRTIALIEASEAK